MRNKESLRVTGLSRRNVLRAVGAAALAAPLGILGSRAASANAPKELKLAWNANAVCLAPVAVGLHRGIFEKHGLKVELINFAGSTDQLLESIATGKADAGVGLIHRWIKPLEQGFDVKLVGSSHGGCLRLVGVKSAGVTDLDKLRGKTIGVSDMSSPGKNFFAIYLSKNGIDPDKDVNWRVYPGNLLGVAVERRGKSRRLPTAIQTSMWCRRRRQGWSTSPATSPENIATSCAAFSVSVERWCDPTSLPPRH